MSLEKASIVWSSKQLKGMVMNGKIDFNHIVQRSYVWEKSRKTGLIESMIMGYPIPMVYAKRIDDGSGKRGSNTYYIMDGKQRLSTIKEFLNDEFALSDIPPVRFFDTELDAECEEDISGLTFSELPEALQDLLNTSTISVTYFDNLTSDEERELFKRLNAGKPLNAKNRALASAADIETLLDIGSHSVFEDMLTDKARDNKNQVSIVMKAWCMLNKNIKDISFESKVFNKLLEDTELEDTDKNILNEVFNLMESTHAKLVEIKEKRVAKKLYTETHFVSLVPYFYKAVESNISEDMMADWLVGFYGTEDKTTSVSDEYNNACMSGIVKNVNIVARDEALKEDYDDFFIEDNMNVESDNVVSNDTESDNVDSDYNDFVEDMANADNESNTEDDNALPFN